MSGEEEQLHTSTQMSGAASVNHDDDDASAPPGPRFKITVELPLFISIMTATLTGAAISNILLYRTCLHSLKHTQAECVVFLSLDRTNQTHLEEDVQKYATYVTTVRSVIESVAPAILSLLVAVWSDTHGRKPLLVWPLFGLSITSMLMVIYSMLDDLGPWWYVLTVVPLSLTGGFPVLFTGAFCYLSDITAEDKRSLRMTILEAGVSLGSVVGSMCSSYILRAIGSVYLLLIVAAFNVIAYAYTAVGIPESLSRPREGTFRSLLDVYHVREMISKCFRRRAGSGRAQILLLTIANCLSVFTMYGLMSLEYLYSREKLHWSLAEYTRYCAAATGVAFAGSFLGVLVVQRALRISDLAFANIAFVSAAVDYSAKSLADTSWHMYLGSTLSMFRGLSAPLLRSLLTKILPPADIAKVFALMSAIEGLCPLVAPVLYNSLYQRTLSSFPAGIYVLSVGVTLVCVLCTGIVQHFRWNETGGYQRLNEM